MRSDAFEPLKARAYAFLITAVSFPSRILMGWMDAALHAILSDALARRCLAAPIPFREVASLMRSICCRAGVPLESI